MPSTAQVFIGSSSKSKPIVQQLVVVLAEYFKPLPWYSSFKAGTFTLEALLNATQSCDFAAFVFGADDRLIVEDQAFPITRDNVLFEYGLFVAALGRERVLLLQEDGIKLPSDLHAVTTRQFPNGDENVREAALSRCLSAVCKDWSKLPPLSRQPAGSQSIDDGGTGFAATLSQEYGRISGISKRLEKYSARKVAADRDPIQLDSVTACISTYCEAVDRVQSRFWTTTFLSSGFWTGIESDDKAQVLESNARMTKRLAAANTRPRRLFLIDQPIAMFADTQKEHRGHLRRMKRTWEIDKLDSAHATLKDRIRRLADDGCELRVVHDRLRLHEILNDQIAFDAHDSELAIYDNFRVDVFEGGRASLINRVTAYCDALFNFRQYLSSADRYFSELWGQAEEMTHFLERLDRAIESSRERLDYEPNWLARYEFGLTEADQDMKKFELGHVLTILQEKGLPGAIRNYLDIGTCTGRYPIKLSELVHEDGRIIGIDDDIDCIQFAKANVLRLVPNDRRIAIIKEDFTEPENSSVESKFDLITCMLGTLSHFGRGRNDRHEDLLQSALRRMADLLKDGGLLLIGTWSEYACERKEMLSIYSEEDRHLLTQWTPRVKDMKKRLREAGLSTKRIQADVHLDLWQCERDTGTRSSSSVPPSAKP